MNQKLSSQERKAAIIDAAVTLFSQKGFRGTTTRELAAAVGVSEPVLYQHFQTKRDLYAAIIERMAAHEQDNWERRVEPLLEGEDDRALFRELGLSILQWHQGDPNLLRLLLFSSLEGHDLATSFFDGQVQSKIDALEGYICRRQRSGAFRQVDPRVAVRAFTGMVANYGFHISLFDRGLTLPDEQVVETMVDLFFKGIETPCEA